MTFPLKTGDQLPEIEIELWDAPGVPANLTGVVQVLFQMAPAEGGDRVISDGAMTVVTLDEGDARTVVRYAWAPTDAATAGEYRAEAKVVFPGGKPRTYPPKGFIAISITDSL